MKLFVRRKAAKDLQRIFEYISRDSPRNARRVINRIRDGIRDSLITFPEMGRRGLVEGTREWHIPDLPYIVIYKVDPGRTRLDVLAIYHGAQDR